MAKEAKSRIKINKLLEESGWRFFDSLQGRANISLEVNTKLTEQTLNGLGEDFEKTNNGFIDFLLLDEKSFPLAVLEAKREEKNPLDSKEQARKYAQSLNVRFIILSNGNLHYFWDIETGNPNIVTSFKQEEIQQIVKRLYKVGGKNPEVKSDADNICNTYGRRGAHFLKELFYQHNNK